MVLFFHIFSNIIPQVDAVHWPPISSAFYAHTHTHTHTHAHLNCDALEKLQREVPASVLVLPWNKQSSDTTRIPPASPSHWTRGNCFNDQDLVLHIVFYQTIYVLYFSNLIRTSSAKTIAAPHFLKKIRLLRFWAVECGNVFHHTPKTRWIRTPIKRIFGKVMRILEFSIKLIKFFGNLLFGGSRAPPNRLS